MKKMDKKKQQYEAVKAFGEALHGLTEAGVKWVCDENGQKITIDFSDRDSGRIFRNPLLAKIGERRRLRNPQIPGGGQTISLVQDLQNYKSRYFDSQREIQLYVPL